MNWDDFDAKAAGGRDDGRVAPRDLQNGDYVARCVSAVLSTTQAGNLMWTLRFQAVEGPCKGASAFLRLVLVETQREHIATTLLAFRVTRAKMTDPDAGKGIMLGKLVLMTIKLQTRAGYNGGPARTEPAIEVVRPVEESLYEKFGKVDPQTLWNNGEKERTGGGGGGGWGGGGGGRRANDGPPPGHPAHVGGGGGGFTDDEIPF